jgi:integrase/recombinase XerD
MGHPGAEGVVDIAMPKPWELRRENQITREQFHRLRRHLRERAELAERRGGRLAIRDEAIILTAFLTGLRRAEIAALTVGDLHLLNQHPFVVVRNGKGGRFREVAVGPRFRADLKRFLRVKEGWGEPVDDAAPLFLSERGRFTGGGIARVFRSACVAAGLPRFNVHLARHFYGTCLFAASKDLRVVRTMLGHARLATTQTYMHLHDEEAADGLAAFEKFIATPPARPGRRRAAGPAPAIRLGFPADQLDRPAEAV